MAFNPTVRDVQSVANEDRRWIKTLMGYDQCRSVTLDISTFDADHLTKKGALPSGIVLTKLGSGKYGAYKGAGTGSGNESVSLIKSGTVSGGTFTLSYDGETTAAIAYDATAGTIATALKALSNIGDNDVAVTGGPAPSTAVVIEFVGALAHANRSNLTLDNTSITGGGTMVATITAGTGGAAAGFLFNSVEFTRYPGVALDLATAPDVAATLYWGPGIIDQDKLPTFDTATSGLLDAAARAALTHLRFEGTDL